MEITFYCHRCRSEFREVEYKLNHGLCPYCEKEGHIILLVKGERE